MSDDHVPAERKVAMMKMQEAIKAAEGRRPERGVEMMLEVVEIDPKFIEPRLWLADFYLANDRKNLAISQYEEILRVDPEHEEAWAKLREVDPMTAERLERLQHIAPDPFVSGRSAASTADLDDFEEDDYLDDEDEEEAAPYLAAPADSDAFMEEDTEPPYYEPLPWEHEQEREYRDKLDESEQFIRLLNGYSEVWYDQAQMETILAGCVEPDRAGFEELSGINEQVCAALGAEPTRVLVHAEWLRIPLTLPAEGGIVVVSAHAHTVFTPHELKFWLAWACHNLLSGAAEYAWAAEETLPHEWKLASVVEAVKQAAAPQIEGWNRDLDEEAGKELARDCQAWEMRAVMSADRAGLLVVGEEAVARRAIAGGCVDLKHAAQITSTQFLGLFRAKEIKELARITMKANPWFDQQYAAYRSHFLRWWATTDDFKKLAAGLGG
ncbi:MAG: hypothetical protein J7M38_04290 [Armatimonadetes bacterium]|nr:hypothetical protein [Armatimonadota bacterium]